MAKRDRKKMKEALKKRMMESRERTTGGKGIFKSGQKLKLWKPDAGEHSIDIVPYIAGVNDSRTAEGDDAYMLLIKVHYGLGTDDRDSAICPKENFGLPCPICEHRKELQAEGADDETLKALKPKDRCIYNIICYDTEKEEDKGVQIWNVSHFYSEMHFQALANKPRRRGKSDDDNFIYFMDADEGKTISFTIEKNKGSFDKYIAHRFTDRDYEISDDHLDEAFVLDELIHVPTYEEVYALYYNEDYKSDEEDAPEEEEDAPDEEEEEKPKSKRTSRKKEKVELKEEDLETYDIDQLLDFIEQEKLEIDEDIDDLDADDLLGVVFEALDLRKEKEKEKEKPTRRRRRR